MKTTNVSLPRQWYLWHAAALVLIMLVGAWLRFDHADWDDGQQFHPDERAILFVAETIELPASSRQALTPALSPLNPFRTRQGEQRPYPYGHLPLYTTVTVQQLLHLTCEIAPSGCQSIAPDTFVGHLLNVGGAPRFNHLTYVGRAFSALCDTLTILAAALLAHALFGWQAGLLASVLACFAVLHLQNAHFGTVDSALALFSTVAVWLSVRYVHTHRRRDSLLAGMAAGLAIGSKVTGLLLMAPLLAGFLAFDLPMKSSCLPLPRLRDHITFWTTVLAAAATFTATNPYVVLDPAPFVSGMVTQARVISGEMDWPFVRQYIGTAPVLYHIDQQARWTLGPLLTLVIYAGLIWTVVNLTRSPRHDIGVVVIWAAAVLFVGGVQFVKFPRYMMPLTPTLFALAGGMLSTRSGGQITSGVNALKLTLAASTMGVTVLYAVAFTAMYRQPHPWLAASQWIYRTLPPGTIVAVERGDDPLPLDLIVDGSGYIRDQQYRVHTVDPFAEPDDTSKLKAMLAQVAESDYMILSSNRLYGVIPRLSNRYPLTAAYYRALFAGDLGFRLERSFSRYPHLGNVMVCDDTFNRAGLPNPMAASTTCSVILGFADESFTIYDHPLVLILRNEAHLTASTLERIVILEAQQ